MSTGPVNHYATLKLERDADATAIKKAYFALIRQFPPETHPEEFQQLRDAYETLRDPEKRQAYDASTNFTAYGDDTGGQLTNAQHAIDSEEWERAIALLVPLVEARPDLHVALDMLGFAYLRTDRVPDARAWLNKAVELRPDVAKYRFHLALTLHEAGNRHAAVDELWKAVELDPKHTDAHRVLVAFAQELEQHDVALKALDHALAHAAPTIFDVFDLTLRKAVIRWKEAGPKWVLATVDELIARVPADADEETRKFLAIRLARLAAMCFSENAINLANAILQRAQQLRPGSQASAPFPRLVDVDVTELPAERQAFLRVARQQSDLSTVIAKLRWNTWWKTVALVGLGALAVAFALSPRGTWSGFEMVMLPLLVTLALAGAALGLQLMWGRLTSEHDEFRFVHGLFFFHVRQNRLRAWPMFMLENIRLTNMHGNSGYTGTVLFAKFGPDVHRVSFRSENDAQRWAQALDAKRVSALEMLATGLVEEDPDARFFPPEMLAAALKKKAALTRFPYVNRWSLIGAGVGVVVALTGFLLSRAQTVDPAFVSAWHGDLDAQAQYLKGRGNAPGADTMRAQRDQRLAAARARCPERALPGRHLDLCPLIAAPGDGPSPILVQTTGDTTIPGKLWTKAVSESLAQLTSDQVAQVAEAPKNTDVPGAARLTIDCTTESEATTKQSIRRCSFVLLDRQGHEAGRTELQATGTGDALDREILAGALLELGVSAEGHPALAELSPKPLQASPYEVTR